MNLAISRVRSYVIKLLQSYSLTYYKRGIISSVCYPASYLYLLKYNSYSNLCDLANYIKALSPDPMPRPENPTPPGTVARITVGGDFNRWLNISQIELVGAAEDPDSKIFQCEVCIARGTPFEQCHIANYTNRVIGGPPVINTTGSKNLNLIIIIIASEARFPLGSWSHLRGFPNF